MSHHAKLVWLDKDYEMVQFKTSQTSNLDLVFLKISSRCHGN